MNTHSACVCVCEFVCAWRFAHTLRNNKKCAKFVELNSGQGCQVAR